MDKLKKVFSPGSSKDDEVLYGDAEQRRASATQRDGSEPQKLYATEGADKKEGGGVLRQVLNPGGDKYDDQRFGTTATTAEPTADPSKLSTTEDGHSKDSTITQQILNPNREKYDEQRFGTMATTTDAPAGHAPPRTVDPNAQLETNSSQKDHSILRQILNPHGDKYDDQAFGQTAHVTGQGSSGTASTTGTNAARPNAQSDAQSVMSIKSGVMGPYATSADTRGTGAASSSAIPDRTAQTTTSAPHLGATDTTGAAATDAFLGHNTSGQDSHLGRDAAVAGGLGAAGAGAYGATRDRGPVDIDGTRATPATTTTTTTTGSQPTTSSRIGSDPVDPTTSQANTSVLDRPHPLGGHSNPHDHINPISAPEEPAAIPAADPQGSSHLGRDAGIAGGLVGAGAATGYAAHEHNQDRSGLGTGTGTSNTGALTGAGTASQLNQAPRDVQSATYTDRQYNIPGDNCDGKPAEGYIHYTHGPHSTDIANRLDPHVPGEFPTEAGEDRHRTGATGLGATTALGGASTIPERDSSRNAPAGGLAQTQPGQEHHYGRDAALAGGAGAAGYGAYEASKDTGPASKTIGPHESNIGNIADPRVQPEPELMKDSKTAGPHQSDMMNKLDPRVEESSKDPSTRDERAAGVASVGTEAEAGQQHHYGRDAGLAAGGAGLAGGAAYAASRDQGAHQPVTEQLAASHQTQTQPPYHATTDSQAATAPGTNIGQPQNTQSLNTASQTGDHHTGRDAALVGGAGAGGAAYAADQAHDGKHDKKLQKEREKEAEKHAKEAEKEQKPSLIHRILHPGEGKEKEKESRHSHDEDRGRHSSDKHSHDTGSSAHHAEDGHNKLHKKALGEGKTTEEAAHHHGTGSDGRVVDPHTGLPMNTEKYGTGAGGTDGAQNIHGYEAGQVSSQPGQEGVAGPDWNAIKKANTPY